MQHQLRLSAFHPQHYQQLLDWIPNEDFLLQWGGPLYQWPLDSAQLDKQLANDEVTACLLEDGDEAIGYCEFIREDTEQVRFCRVLIGPTHLRGQGLGKQLLELAIQYAARQLNAKRLALYVFADNQAAVSLYQSFQFETVSQESYLAPASETSRIVFRMEREVSSGR